MSCGGTLPQVSLKSGSMLCPKCIRKKNNTLLARKRGSFIRVGASTPQTITGKKCPKCKSVLTTRVKNGWKCQACKTVFSDDGMYQLSDLPLKYMYGKVK
jgi:hypothetical protein